MTVKKNKTHSTIALILILAMAIPLATFLPAVQAVEIPTYLIVSAAPNPVGVGQTVYLNAFLSKPTPSAGMGGTGDHYERLTIEITRPDGTKQTIGPMTADAVGGIWGSFVPTQVGSYKIQAFYPGQTFSYGTYNGSIAKPSVSEIVTLIAQQQPISTIPNTPLPTGYWSRPIYSTNYDWAQLGGNWFGLRAASFAVGGMYDANGNFAPYTTAPNTGHIVWTKPTAFGGQVGAPYNADQESQYTSTSILIYHFEPIVINGVLFYDHYPSVTSRSTSWNAVDLRTGETLWTRTPGETGDERLRMGQVLKFHSMQEYGSFPLLWSVPRTGSTVFRLYDAMTGTYLGNITGASNLAFIMDFDGINQGTLLGWNLASGNLTMWNSTLAMAYPNGFTGSEQLTLRPSANITFSAGIQWSVPIATTIAGVTISPAMSIAARTPEVILLRGAPNIAPQTNTGYSVEAGYSAKTGQLLWGPVNRTIPAYQDTAFLAARDGVYVTHNKDTNEAYGYSLTNGQQLWGPVKLPGNAFSSISRAAEIAYGKVYIWDFGGYVNALDAKTGVTKWTFTPRSAGYDTPYGIYPMWHFGTHSICDGKLFLSEASMYTPPLFPGAQRLAIDCETGELVWSILSFSGRICAAHADGYMVQWNSFDNQIYTFGKGPTATTISASPKISVHGSSVLIEGMVTDESPGTTDSDRKARFPNGVPAIADESMSPWMEYVYMQQPKPADVKGVQVKLTANDPNGNTQDIGTVTSNNKGNYAITWTPPVPGLYTITATFEGSNSYYSSDTETAFVVSEAPAASPTAAPALAPTLAPTAPPASPTATVSPSVVPLAQALPSTDSYIVGAAAAVVIVIVAVAAVVLRKRK